MVYPCRFCSQDMGKDIKAGERYKIQGKRIRILSKVMDENDFISSPVLLSWITI